MPSGPGGKYDAELEYVYAQTGADAALVVILGGNKGAGFGAKGDIRELIKLPYLLRKVAADIEQEHEAYLHKWMQQAKEQAGE